MNHEEIVNNTHEAMLDPQVGDRFHEFFTHWVYVVKVTDKYIWTLAASAPCEFPKDGILIRSKKDEFREYYSYKCASLPNKYWVDLCDRGKDVSGWFESKKKVKKDG